MALRTRCNGAATATAVAAKCRDGVGGRRSGAPRNGPRFRITEPAVKKEGVGR